MTSAALTKTFSNAEALAQQYPQNVSQTPAAAKSSFRSGDHWAYTAGVVAILIGAALVAGRFPGRDQERELLAEYQDEDALPGSAPGHQ